MIGRPLIPRICQNCGCQFFVKKNKIDYGGAIYCSVPCTLVAVRAGKVICGIKPRDPIEFLKSNYIPVPYSGCYLWCGPYTTLGYGVLVTKERKLMAHREMLKLHVPCSDQSLCACHKCDVPACVNPDHLFWGTQKDNMVDASMKGRCRTTPKIGVDHHGAILTEADVLGIRAAPPRTARATAERFGVSIATVYEIRQRRSWRHLP